MPSRVITAAGHAMLDIKKHVAFKRIPAAFIKPMEKAELNTLLDRETGDLILQLSARIPGKVFDKKEHYYPADWWQAFKERWLKSALSRRVFGSPSYAMISMTAEASYPSIHVPNHKPFVQVTMKKTP